MFDGRSERNATRGENKRSVDCHLVRPDVESVGQIRDPRRSDSGYYLPGLTREGHWGAMMGSVRTSTSSGLHSPIFTTLSKKPSRRGTGPSPDFDIQERTGGQFSGSNRPGNPSCTPALHCSLFARTKYATCGFSATYTD